MQRKLKGKLRGAASTNENTSGEGTDTERIKKKIQPLIKWTGGKYDEYQEFKHLIPSFDRYYEPFFGGGGVFFALQPQGTAFLNDTCTDLIRFYTNINKLGLQKELWKYVKAWEQTGSLAAAVGTKLATTAHGYVNRQVGEQVLAQAIGRALSVVPYASYTPLFDTSFAINTSHFIDQLKRSIRNKCTRLKAIGIQERCRFSRDKVMEQIETAIKGGFYVHIRSLTNEHTKGASKMSEEKAIANWYVVRQLCYASMFRFNQKGEFNIPYGGTSYNHKDVAGEVAHICSSAVQDRLSRTTFSNHDFEAFLTNTNPTKDDFVFVDPPYDTPFSDYDQHPFTKKDHERLRNVLINLNAQWLLVIENTPFITALYANKGLYFSEYCTRYRHCIKGRGNRQVAHLIIKNYR